jgi:hypothetical protein
MKRFKHALIAAWAAAAFGGSAAAKETIVIGDVSWEASHAVANVLKVVIESKLGAEVKIIPADQAAIFAAMGGLRVAGDDGACGLFEVAAEEGAEGGAVLEAGVVRSAYLE